MNASDIFAGASSAVSLVALWVSYHTYQGTLRSSVRPILVFRSTSDHKWRVENVGTGPAIKVLVVDFGKNRRNEGVTNCFPIASGSGLDLGWLDNGFELGVIYTDRFGSEYSTTCIHNTNKVGDKNELSTPDVDVDQWVQQLSNRTRGSALRAREYRKWTAAELDLKRNEIYARHGYDFRRDDLRLHFSQQDWYKPMTSKQSEVESLMSPDERYEARLILHIQYRFGLRVDPPKAKCPPSAETV